MNKVWTSDPRLKLFQPFRRQLQSFIFLAEAKPYLLRTSLGDAVKTGARHTGNANLTNQMPGKLDIIRKSKPRNVGHDVVSTIRSERHEACLLKLRQEQIPA